MSNIIGLPNAKQIPEDPLAARLRSAVKQACDPNRPVIVSADASGNIKATPPPTQEVKLTPFPNGMLFGYTANPRRPGTQLIHDAAGVNVALAISEEVANIICKGCHIFFQLAQKEIAEAKAKGPIDVESAVVAAEKVEQTLTTPV